MQVYRPHAADSVLTWGSRPYSSCSCSYRGVAEEGSRPECERDCAWRSEEVSEEPAGGAGRGQPLREWQEELGRRGMQWEATDLHKETDMCSMF